MSDAPYAMSIHFSLKIDDYDGTPVTSSEPIIVNQPWIKLGFRLI